MMMCLSRVFLGGSVGVFFWGVFWGSVGVFLWGFWGVSGKEGGSIREVGGSIGVLGVM